MPRGVFSSRPSNLKRRFVTADSGLVSEFVPAQKVKPKGLISKIVGIVSTLFHNTQAENTSEQGAAGAASPATYRSQLYAQRYERRSSIMECRLLEHNDPRIRRSIYKMAKEATRQGCRVTISSEVSGLEDICKEVADEIQRFHTSELLRSWARMLMVEGDLFVQLVTDSKGEHFLKCKRMPAVAIERMTDDADEFMDVNRAFAQIDTATNAEVAVFPLALMYHARWNWVDGERYGQSELTSTRRLTKLVDVTEEALAVNRMTNAPQKILWNVGTEEYPGTKEDVEEFRELYGFIGGKRDMWDATETARDFVGNGLTTGEVLKGDPQVGEIKDVLHLQDVMMTGMPTPGFIFGLNVENINRDVMKDLRAEWLKEVQDLSDTIGLVIRWATETALLLRGVHPDLVDIAVVLTDSTIMTPQEIIQGVVLLYEAALVSQERAVSKVAEYTGVTDVAKEIESIRQDIKDGVAGGSNNIAMTGQSVSGIGMTMGSKPKNNPEVSKKKKTSSDSSDSVSLFG